MTIPQDSTVLFQPGGSAPASAAPVSEAPSPWIRRLVWLSLLLAFPLLLLGTMVTTFRVGMVDPLWPTEPWYLMFDRSRPDAVPIWKEERPGYLIEHFHRVFGYLIGLTILAQTVVIGFKSKSFGIWLSAVVGVTAGTVLTMSSIDRAAAQMDPLTAVQPGILRAGLGVLLAGVGAFLIAIFLEYREKGARRHLMALGFLVFLGVISQGLLGGMRVYLNALGGTQLASIHGALGQIVVSGLVGLLAICALQVRPIPAMIVPKERRGILIWSLGLLFLCLVQLGWAVWLRHFSHPVAQRMHLFFACLIPAFVVGVHLKALANREVFKWFGPSSGMLLLLVFLQVLIGIEAYIGKFATNKPLVEAAVNVGQAAVRTTHAMIGALILAAAAVIALRALWIPKTVPAMQGVPTGGAVS